MQLTLAIVKLGQACLPLLDSTALVLIPLVSCQTNLQQLIL